MSYRDVIVHPQKQKENELNGEAQGEEQKKKKICCIYIFISVFIILIVGIIVAIIVLKIPKPPEPYESCNNTKKKLEIEEGLNFKTEVGNLYKIKVEQQYNETTVTNGKNISYFFDRKSIYIIYVISESEPTEKLKYCYSKLYTCSISIVAECENDKNDSCVPSPFLDLTGESFSNETEAGDSLQAEDFETIPVPLCLFNITDNNAITSIKCHKSINEGRVKGLILDIYFFRSPAVKRIKENNNITININDLEDGKKFVRETNGGICRETNLNSFCSTDMNITKDSENNLISYKERATTYIRKNSNNYYNKIKKTNLDDITEKNDISNAKLYKQNMEKLLEAINPYLHYYEQVSEEKFLELYELSANGKDPKKENKMNKVRKEEKNEPIIKEENIFEYEGLDGGHYYISTLIDSSLYGNSMKAYSLSKFNEDFKDNIVSNNQESNLSRLLKKIIISSKAGNYLANQLYQNTKKLFGEITQDIQLKISNLNKLISYENITKVFDSSLQLDDLENLTIGIVDETNILNENFNRLSIGLKSPNTKKKFSIINNNIYDDFLYESHKFLDSLSKDFQELVKSMKSDENKYTQISLYYQKKNGSSYTELFKEIEEILMNYYKNEANLIKSNISSMIENFENNFNEISNNEINMIIELIQKLNNKIINIENIDDNTLKETINNLNNSINAFKNIGIEIKDLINKQMNLKDDYFSSQTDIKLKNISFANIINTAKENVEIIDNKLIDKKYDEIRSNFSQKFSDDLISIGKEIENQFNLEEESLKNTLFRNKENDITAKFKGFSINVINELKNEMDEYEDKINSTIMSFLADNEEKLNLFIYDLYVLFSNESLLELVNLYDEAFNSSLNTITELINNNEILAKQYLDDMEKVVNNNTYIESLIHDINSFQNGTDVILEHYFYESISHYDEYQFHNESIISKKITKAYLSKYNYYKANIKNSEDYINSQLNFDFFNNYKNPIVELRRILHKIKSNKLNEKYPKFQEIGFSKHKKIIDILYKRLDAFLSDDIYNKKYLTLQNNYKKNIKQNITQINDYIENKNNLFSNKAIVFDYDYDYCVVFKRIKSYLCNNGNWNYPTYSDDYCYSIPNYTENHIHLKQISIESKDEFKIFNKKFNEFFSTLNQTVENYILIMNKLNDDLKIIEDEIMNKKAIINYISEFQDNFNKILENYFGNNLVRNSYEKYKNNTMKKIENIFEKVKNSWNNEFEMLETDINNNIYNFTSSLDEFRYLALIYSSIMTQNISINYYNSIIDQQKKEVNYTISYYYNYLLRLANSTQNYIINRILSNHYTFDYIEKQKINIINRFFRNIVENITLSEKNALNLENQLYILGVDENDFFKVNYIYEEKNHTICDSLDNKFLDIMNIKNNIKFDKYSLVAKMYSENLVSRNQIPNLYKQIDEKNFIKLNKDKFEEIIINNNWLFNFDEFTNEIDEKLYNLKNEIEEEFSNHKENYTKTIENILNEYLTKEGIIKKINELYYDGIKIIDEDMKTLIIKNIREISNSIKEHLENETIRIQTANSFNKDTSLINNTIKYYKKEIINKLNKTIIIVAKDFNQNIINKLYENYIEIGLNKFYEQLKIKNELYMTEYTFLNSKVLNFKEIIDDILIDIKKEYKTITEKYLSYKYNKKLREIYNIINITEIENIINNIIDSEYEKENGLLFIIEQKGYNDAGYNEYNFNDIIKNDIENSINITINNIEQIINETKGNNYQINLNWEDVNQLDFTIQYTYIITDEFKIDFDKFWKYEEYYEKNSINELLEEVVKNNFNNLLNYLIPTFGKLFIERMVKYNENFKVIRLYDNLKYVLDESLVFYIFGSEVLDDIPDDLERILYNLNDLELTIKNNINQGIINKINNELDEFIGYIQKKIIEKYNTSYINKFSTEQKYNERILSMIKSSLFNVEMYIKKNTKNILEEYLKKPFIMSYQKVINEKTKEMLMFVNEQKEILKIEIFNIKKIFTNNILQKINITLDKTKDSLNKYLSHFNTFKIDNEFIQFLYNYGNDNIKPLFLNVINMVNDAKSNNKKIILDFLNKSSQVYEDYFDMNEFINLSNDTYLYFKNNYIKNFTEHIKVYDPDNYRENFERQKLTYERRYLRNLEGNETKEDIENKYRERISDKALDIIFNDISRSSNMVKDFLNGLNEFEDFDEKIKTYMKLLNDNYKLSQNLIKDKKEKGVFDEELFNTYNERLKNLDNMTKNYYYNINESYFNLKDYLNKSLNEIDESLNNCKNVTNIVFKDEYIQIKNEMMPYVFQNYSNEKEEIKEFKYPGNSSNNAQIDYEVTINSINKANFSLDLIFEDIYNYNPTVIAKIINLSAPKKLNMKIIKGSSSCIEKTERDINIDFGAANYSMIISYNTQSTKINITIITNFENYAYNTEEYKFEKQNSGESGNSNYHGIIIDMNRVNLKCEKVHKDDYLTPVDGKNSTHQIIIDDFI